MRKTILTVLSLLWIIFVLFICISPVRALTPAQLNNMSTELYKYCWEGHTKYCNSCSFEMWCNIISFAKDYLYTMKTADFTTKAENFITKAPYIISKTGLDIKQNITIQNNLLYLKATWQRDRQDIIDYIPCITLLNQTICFTKWATWYPTFANFTYPLNSSLISGITLVNATINDSALIGVNYRMEWYNGTPAFSWIAMSNSSTTNYYGSFDTALYNDGDYILRLNIKGKILYETNTTGANTQTSGADSNGWRGQQFTIGSSGANESFDVYSVEVEMYRTGLPENFVLEIYNLDGSGYPTGAPISTGSFNASKLTETTGNLYNVLVSNTTLLAGVQYGFMIRGLSQPPDTYVWLRGISSQTYYGGDMLYTQNNGSTFGTTANWDVRFNIYGQNYNTTLTSNITILQSPNPPSCAVADIDNDYWHYDITKLLIPDGVLSMSGCIRADYWDNGTEVNQSWIATSSNWYNKTGIAVLEFVGTHYVRLYCNDSIDVWVSCSLDSYDITSGGGLTAEEHSRLMSLTNPPVLASDIGVVYILIVLPPLMLLIYYLLETQGRSNPMMLFLSIVFSLALILKSYAVVMLEDLNIVFFPMPYVSIYAYAFFLFSVGLLLVDLASRMMRKAEE